MTAAEAPVPVGDRDTEAWWAELAAGRLTIPCCWSCETRFFPPQPYCHACGSGEWSLASVRGTGRVYSWVVTHRAFAPEFAADVPYAIVAVDLDDVPRGDERVELTALTVDRDPARLDQLVRGAARGDTGAREVAVEAHALHCGE